MEDNINIVAPRYRRIAVDIATKIVGRQYEQGEKVYARTLIAAQYAVSAETARRAIAVLSDMGIVETVRGSGVVIRSYENALRFVKLNQDTSTMETLRRDTLAQAARLMDESAALKEKVAQLVDRATQLRGFNPFVPYEIRVEGDCPCKGKSIAELNFWQNTSATVVALRREQQLILSPGPYEVLQEEDWVYFVGDENCFARVTAFLAAGI